MGQIIGGTVIQRSFIGREAANIIHVATVPVSELGVVDNELNAILAEVLGIPMSNVLDGEGYQRVTDLLRSYPPDYFFPYRHPNAHRYFDRVYDSLHKDGSPKELFSDFLATAGNPSPVVNAFQLWPFFAAPEFLAKLEINQDVLVTAMQCIASRSVRSQQAESFIQEVFEYDIPMGQSPSVKADSLLQLLETSRKFCVAPLALGGTQALNQLAQGNYVAALLTTSTAGVMTLVLIGTVSVGALIVQKVAQVRAKG